MVGEAGIVGVLLGERAFGVAELELQPGYLGSAAGFAQASEQQNRELQRAAAQAAAVEGLTLLELYAGDGNLTRALMGAKRGVVVEGDRAAARRLAANLLRLGAQHLAVRAEPAEAAVRALAADGARFDVVVLDPPRAGARDVAERLPALAPTRIVYVSCDPQTLARDAAALARAGYRPARVVPLDMAPGTYHVECVCCFERT
jgi:23S rRNA (uracil1939-C5)-methyltransferase